METIAKISLCLFASLAINTGMPTDKFGMPANCTNTDICTERHELYPQHLVNEMVKTSQIALSDGKPDLGQRDAEENEERDCEVDIDNKPIYEIIDADGDVRVVLQTELSFQQIVYIERCLKPGHIDYPTKHFNMDMVEKFNMHCVEQKLNISLIVLTKDWRGVEMVRPKSGIPVRCDCKFF